MNGRIVSNRILWNSRILSGGLVLALFGLFVSVASAQITYCPRKPVLLDNQGPRELDGFFRQGQTFLTWNEDTDAVQETYRIYRHTEIITNENLHTAALLAEVEEGSSLFREMHYLNGDLLPTGDNGNNVIPRFVLHDLGQPLASDVGLFVHTVKEPAAEDYFYAVTVVIDGVEIREITPDNSTGPISEAKEHIGAVRYYQYNGRTWYTLWLDYDLFKDSYMGYAFVIGLTDSYFTGGYMPHMHLDGIGTMNIYTAGYTRYGQGDFSDNGLPTWYFGHHASKEYDGTYATGADLSGDVANYIQYRIMQAVLWARREFSITEKNFHISGNSMGASGAYGLAMAYPSFVTSVLVNQGLTDYENSGLSPQGSIMWRDSIRGNYGEPALLNPVYLLPFEDPDYPELDWYLQFDGMDVYSFRNVAGFLAANTATSFGLISSGHSMNDGSIQYESQGAHFEAYIKDSRHCFSYHVNDNYHGWGAIEGSRMLHKMRWDESRPGFSNVPPMPVYRYNDYNYLEANARGYMLGIEWGTSEDPYQGQSIQDTQTEWVLPIGLIPPSNAPVGWYDSFVVDVTPRNLQLLPCSPGSAFDYEITTMAGIVEQSGVIMADSDNLLLIPDVPIRPEGVLVRITAR